MKHLELNLDYLLGIDERGDLVREFEEINQDYKDDISAAECVARERLHELLKRNKKLVPHGCTFLCWIRDVNVYDIGLRTQFDVMKPYLIDPSPLQALFEDC